MGRIALNSNFLKIDSNSGESLVTLLSGDNKNLLSQIKDGQISCVVQDEPYGENPKPIDLEQYLRSALNGLDYMRTGKGIANEKWDCDVPPISHRRELYRILKSGGYALCFTSNKNVDLVMFGMRMAGFKIVDLIAWVHTQGVPKGHNLDSVFQSDPNLSQYIGYRRDLSSSMEIVIVAQKPIAEHDAVTNLKMNGTGLLNVASCLIPHYYGETRYPKNVILEATAFVDHLMKGNADKFLRIDPLPIEKQIEHTLFFHKPSIKDRDLGLENELIPYRHLATFGNKEIDGKNHHRTVKPVALMQYLVRLVSRPNDLVLDSFVGSGTTGVAAILENRRFVGAELMPDYFDVASRRLKNIFQQNEFDYLTARRKQIAAQFILQIHMEPDDRKKKSLQLAAQIELYKLDAEILAVDKRAA